MTREPIDLRSDTVTKPTEAMREAMQKAEVGDDVFEDDQTVKELEAKAAQKMGKQAGLFVPSGTMGNLVALLSHCQRGDQIIVAKSAHIFQYEQGSASSLGSISFNPVDKGSKTEGLSAEDIEENIAPEDVHKPKTKLVCLENTLNGRAIAVNEIDDVCKVAKEKNLKVHLDGARIFNAATALKVEAKEIVKNVDTVQFCFSKGLSAPVGSILIGSESFIARARRWRKAVGGGMRQVGVLAAPCLIALEEMTKRLAEDHSNANQLAEGLNAIDGLNVDLKTCHTNMVWIKTDLKDKFAKHLVETLKDKKGILVLEVGKNLIRAVTHYGITSDDIERTITSFEDAVKELKTESKTKASLIS